MRVVSYLQGSASRILTQDEYRPEIAPPYADVEDAIAARYGFRARAQAAGAAQFGVMAPVFQMGKFVSDGTAYQVISLEVGPQMITASCPTTDIADKLLDDLFEFATRSLGFKLPERQYAVVYNSTLIAQCSMEFVDVFGKWQSIQNRLQLLVDVDHPGLTLVPFGIKYLGSINGVLVGDVSLQFTFEKRVVAPETENWQFTQAPLRTKSHVELLNFIESTFTAGPGE